jgi:uncharacterized RDD family membrane protein YckC
LIDLGIVAVYVVVLGMIIAVVFPLVSTPLPSWVAMALALAFIETPIGVWWWRQEATTGTTIGKRIEGLRVVVIGTDEAPSSLRCAIRVVAQLLPWGLAHILLLVADDPQTAQPWALPGVAVIVTIAIVSIAAAYVRPDRRAGYDLVANTQVVMMR